MPIPTPLVSVCMPASRPSAWFEQALRSVLSQSMPDFEVIITDDSGGSLEPMVSSFGDPRIRYLPNPSRLGFAGNHCRAIDASRGEYVAFLHDDDMWAPEFLEATAAVLSGVPEVGVLLTGADEIDAEGRVLGERPAHMSPGCVPDALRRVIEPRFMLLLPSVSLIRRRALDANRRPWPDVIAADLTMYVDILEAGWQLYYLDRQLVHYRVHSQQIGSDDFAHRHALVSVWGAYRFRDADAEATRRHVFARALVGRAAALLRRNQPDQAREDLSAARATSPETARGRRMALGVAARLPGSVVPFVESAWAWMGRRHRHQGV